MNSGVNLLKIQEVRQSRRDTLTWSQHEEIFRRSRPSYFANRSIPFRLVNRVKIRRSMFGTFLEELNSQQDQDEELNETKLDILNFDKKYFTNADTYRFARDNDFTEDLEHLLVKAVKKLNVIRGEFLYKHIHALRYVDLPMTVLDDGLRKFKRLQKLVFSGNFIEGVYGEHLPRRLQYLELFANYVRDLEDFCRRAPRQLVYVGLQRNLLNNASHLHLLAECGRFEALRCLDLAENDISDLKFVLNILKKLPSLRYLQLQGNPCSVLCVYKDAVLQALPRLVILDNTEILSDDRELFKFAVDMKAAIVFSCHWIIGLAPPPKHKGVIHTFYIEVGLPLLEDIILEPGIPETIDENVEATSSVELSEGEDKEKSEEKVKGKGKSQNKSKGKSKDKSSKGKSTKASSKGGKKKKKESPYDAPDEYEEEKKAGRKATNTSFKTDRFSWAKVIQLPEEALVIRSVDGNLTDIRDTFRCRVNVKLIYLQIEDPTKKKKAKRDKNKKKKKDKAKKKDKKSKSDKKKNDDEQPEPPPATPAVEPEPAVEVILKKITLANFWCHLHSINWSDKSIDYFWANCRQTKLNAVEVEGSLRATNYTEGGLKRKSIDTTENTLPPVPLPKYFTCQVGFGLKRSYYQDFYLE